MVVGLLPCATAGSQRQHSSPGGAPGKEGPPVGQGKAQQLRGRRGLVQPPLSRARPRCFRRQRGHAPPVRSHSAASTCHPCCCCCCCGCGCCCNPCPLPAGAHGGLVEGKQGRHLRRWRGGAPPASLLLPPRELFCCVLTHDGSPVATCSSSSRNGTISLAPPRALLLALAPVLAVTAVATSRACSRARKGRRGRDWQGGQHESRTLHLPFLQALPILPEWQGEPRGGHRGSSSSSVMSSSHTCFTCSSS